ncbi:methyltransferase domain-containing protein [Streptomyces apocyni]|uniref:methyltransferase domain-containing protein n=1 Tax=Streptomyces apocyni TaxID=2654677 RepID=UPI0012E9AD34|nr:methyltransferase domain-containing protein [Streptomyces apocyni]
MTRIDGHLLDHGHLLDPGQSEATRRCEALPDLFDATTFRHLERLGVGPGWRCWEVAAGGTSVLTWLAKRVGPTGRVLATDVDTSWVGSAARPPIEVLRHDVGAEEPPGEGFDLVHARLVLADVAERDRALRSMVRALRPGGRILVEETDTALQPLTCPDEHGPAQRLANRLREGRSALLAEDGADLSYGRKLPRLLRAAGLTRVEADAHFPLGAGACSVLETAGVSQARERLVAAGRATDTDIDRHLENVASGALDLAATPMVSAWGRKP